MHGLLLTLLPLDSTVPGSPPDDKVVAGKVAMLIFVLLIAMVVFLGLSMVKQFRKVNAAKEAGLYDESRKEREAREARERAEGQERETLTKQSNATDPD